MTYIIFPYICASFLLVFNLVVLTAQLFNESLGDIYEHAVVLSVKMEDQEAFERDFCQLKPYYTDAK